MRTAMSPGADIGADMDNCFALNKLTENSLFYRHNYGQQIFKNCATCFPTVAAK